MAPNTITLHAAGLAIGVLSVEPQELHAERSAFPIQKFSASRFAPMISALFQLHLPG
jgi:hypothetical protein